MSSTFCSLRPAARLCIGVAGRSAFSISLPRAAGGGAPPPAEPHGPAVREGFVTVTRLDIRAAAVRYISDHRRDRVAGDRRAAECHGIGGHQGGRAFAGGGG